MASTINAKNTSTGVVITPDSSGQLELQTADTTRMTIDVNGNVGVGTSSPSEKLEVIAGAAQTARMVVGGGNTAVIVINGDRDNSGDTGTEDCSLVFNADGNYSQFTNSGLGSNGFRIGALNNVAASQLTFTSINGGVDTERMRIDSSGRVTMPFQPAFLASSSSGTHTTSIGSVLDFNSVYLDRGSNFNTSTYRFTAPTAGYYVFYYQVYTQNGATPKSICWRKNGSQVIVSSEAISYQGAVNISDFTLSSSAIINLAAGDYVDVAVRLGSSNLQWFGGHSWFQGYLLG